MTYQAIHQTIFLITHPWPQLGLVSSFWKSRWWWYDIYHFQIIRMITLHEAKPLKPLPYLNSNILSLLLGTICFPELNVQSLACKNWDGFSMVFEVLWSKIFDIVCTVLKVFLYQSSPEIMARWAYNRKGWEDWVRKDTWLSLTRGNSPFANCYYTLSHTSNYIFAAINTFLQVT